MDRYNILVIPATLTPMTEKSCNMNKYFLEFLRHKNLQMSEDKRKVIKKIRVSNTKTDT